MVAVDERLMRQRKRVIARDTSARRAKGFAGDGLFCHREHRGSQRTADARGYRISEAYPQGGTGIPAGATKNLYYSTNGQVIEERFNGTASSDTQYQYVWSATYVNAMVLRDTFAAGTIQPNSRIYALNDTNYNVTALVTYNAVTQTWGVSERFVYSPYGSVETFDANYNPATDAFNWQYMYQGGRFDTATGLYHFGTRNYSPSLGAWISQDPMQYVNGANTYQFVGGNPVGSTDALGLDPWGPMPLGTPYNWTPPRPPPPMHTVAHNVGTNIVGDSIKVSDILKVFTPVNTAGSEAASFEVMLTFAYRSGHTLPKVVTDTHSVKTLGGWGGEVAGRMPVVGPMMSVYDGHKGEFVHWHPFVGRSASLAYNVFVGGAFGLIGFAAGGVAAVETGPGAIAAAIAGGGIGAVTAEALNPSYSVKIMGDWFVWQDTTNCSVHIVNVNGSTTATTSTPLPTTVLGIDEGN